MLEDGQPACVLTHTEIAQRLPETVAQLLLDHPDILNALAWSQESNPSDGERTHLSGTSQRCLYHLHLRLHR